MMTLPRHNGNNFILLHVACQYYSHYYCIVTHFMLFVVTRSMTATDAVFVSLQITDIFVRMSLIIMQYSTTCALNPYPSQSQHM